MAPSKPPQRVTPSPHPLRRTSDAYGIYHPPFFSLKSYVSKSTSLSHIPSGLEPHIIHIVRTSERQPPAPEEPEISVFVNSRLGKNHTIFESSHHRQADRTEIRCCASDTIGEFKRKATAQLGLRMEGMVLRRWAGEPGLNDGLMLGDYEIVDGSSLDMEIITGDSLDLDVGEGVVDSSKSP